MSAGLREIDRVRLKTATKVASLAQQQVDRCRLRLSAPVETVSSQAEAGNAPATPSYGEGVRAR